jgi:hypothetical protein
MDASYLITLFVILPLGGAFLIPTLGRLIPGMHRYLTSLFDAFPGNIVGLSDDAG